MWDLMETLFPIHRALCGPGFLESLHVLQKWLPLEIAEFPTGSKAFDWVIPPEFIVHEAYVEGPDGQRYLDFRQCSYHVWNYSQPFDGEMDREELLQHITTLPALPDAIPLRVTYYRPKWGLCASEAQVRALPPGRYRVHINTEFRHGALRIGEYYLPGETDTEILITAYLCHPRGANDNLSGVVLGTELFTLLAQLPQRRYSYRLALWPETIGAITYIANYPERLSRLLGGYVLHCAGDPGPVHYKTSYHGTSLIDRAAIHALQHAGNPHHILPYMHHSIGPDACQFNAIGLRLPFGTFMRTPPGDFPAYHSSADDLSLVRPEALLDTLQRCWDTLMTLERAVIYQGHFTVDPFLTGHGIYPYAHGAGEGKLGNDIATAYYHLMGGIDGQTDLLAIAERAALPIAVFDHAVQDFLRVGLMHPHPPAGA